MSENNKNHPQDEIDRILAEYQQQRDDKVRRQTSSLDDTLPPPVRRENIIDFSKNDEMQQPDQPEEELKAKRKRTPEEIAQAKEERAKKLGTIKEKSFTIFKKLFGIVFNKATVIVLAAVVVIVGVIFGVKAIIDSKNSAYLKPYEEKYNVEFPVGIIEKYCDYYGENQSTVGYVELDDIIATPVFEKSAGLYPAAEGLTENAEQGNIVIYTDNRSIEKVYSTAGGYNGAKAEIMYSDLFNEYTFRVIGAFYTNKNPKDDNGYIFPYNTAEKMTSDSASALSDRLNSRLLYYVGITLTRADRLIFISCPTDYRKDFSFVLVGVQRDKLSDKPYAQDRPEKDIHFPQLVYDERKLENPYRFATKWYPEIEITNPDTKEVSTIKLTKKDYQSRYPR